MIEAIIFDWAGTTVDFGSRAPLKAFVRLFESIGIRISIDEARAPMGLNKKNHIQALLEMPQIKRQWLRINERTPTKDDVDHLYAAFIPMNKSSIAECSELVPGMAELARKLTAMNIKIGSTTGYTPELMDALLLLAKDQGYAPEVCLCSGDTPLGRPSSQMMQACAEKLGITEPRFCIKVDDTQPGIEEGKNFGCWTVGVALSGNALGLSLQELKALPEQEAEKRKAIAREKARAMSCDYVIDTVADLLPVVEKINSRLSRKERPKMDSRFRGNDDGGPSTHNEV